MNRFALEDARLTWAIPPEDCNLSFRDRDMVRNVARPNPLCGDNVPPQLIVGFRHGKRAVHPIEEVEDFLARRAAERIAA